MVLAIQFLDLTTLQKSLVCVLQTIFRDWALTLELVPRYDFLYSVIALPALFTKTV